MDILELKTFLISLPSFRDLKIKSYPTEIECLLSLTPFLPPDVGLSQRAWHIINDKLYVINCIECNGPTGWWVQYKRYRDFCSHHCRSTSTITEHRRQQTSIEKFGTLHPCQNNELKEKQKQTLLERYGVDSPLKSPIIMDKARNTWAENYNRSHPNYKLLHDEQWLREQYIVKELSTFQLSRQLDNIDNSTISRYLKNYGIETRKSYRSFGEIEVEMFLQNDCGVQTRHSDRSIIHPLELDIVIDSHKIAIEYCGIYWHSEQAGKHKSYHKNKMDYCRDKGYRLITIFEDEWQLRNTQVKQKLKRLFGIKDKQRIFARTTVIKNVSTKEKHVFFENHHMQGDGPGSYNIGLYKETSLVSCLTAIVSNKEIIINRYATSCQVVGGFSKLLTKLSIEFPNHIITSFADLRWSDGNMYIKSNFKQIKLLPPDYSYSFDRVHRLHKFGLRRKFLAKKLKIYDPTLTEKQNCDANNVLRIWDCGKIKFEYIRK